MGNETATGNGLFKYEEIYVPKKKKKKKETFTEKARRKLREYVMPKKQESKAPEGRLQPTISKINRRRKLLEESLKY